MILLFGAINLPLLGMQQSGTIVSLLQEVGLPQSSHRIQYISSFLPYTFSVWTVLNLPDTGSEQPGPVWQHPVWLLVY